ncbi:unnamed protein product [Cuscuta europaea]|uniref:Ethylene-insensitive protein 2 n=1 Tax=Cuscuta europaea TaxID=41803 RepID=A0A9P0ZJN5_CUSEU|nr:unnamed protein product [Cuscuta europaea]
MEPETLNAAHQTSTFQRFLSAVVPVLFITIGYVDPGKWAAVVEGGGRFGFHLTLFLLLFNLVAILCQYLSARVAVVTGRNLAQICSEEYDKVTCIFLGFQAEISIIALDLSMVLATAHGLNVIFGIDLFSCVFLTATNAVFFPLFSTLLDISLAKFLCIGWMCFILLLYVLGVLISQPENPFTVGEMLTKLNGESSFALMSLLGASIMPHNFYLHSSIIQQEQTSKRISRGALCQDHFFAIVSIFSGIFLVNYMLLNLAASAFYNTGLVLLTFHEALSLLDQVFGSSITPFVMMLVMLFSNQSNALTWDIGRQVVVEGLFGLELPGWLHHATVRVIAIVPALYCVWNSGAEGLYQLLIYTQEPVLEFEEPFRSSHLDISNPKLLDSNLPESLLKFERSSQLTTIDEITYARDDVDLIKNAPDRVSISEPPSLPAELLEVVEETKQIGAYIQDDDKDDAMEMWEPEEATTKEMPLNDNQSLTFDSPGSLKNASEKYDDLGSGTGSLSRLAGLGRAARRQLTTVLDEFWGQLFDFHGQVIPEAKSNKMDVLLGAADSKMDPKPPSGSLKLESIRKDINTAILSDSLIGSDIYSPKQMGREFAYSAKEPSSLRLSHMKMLDAYSAQSSIHSNNNNNCPETSERRYSSMRIPASSSNFDQQPATVHGYDMSSYLNQITKERYAEYLNSQQKESSPMPKSNYVEQYASGGVYRQKPQNISSTRGPPGFTNVSMSRNKSLAQPGKFLNDLYPTTGNGGSASTKKYYSLPDISGLYMPNRNPSPSHRLDSSVGGYAQSLYGQTYSRPPGFTQLSPSKVCRDAFSLQFSSNPVNGGGSLWYTQPFEQFGVDKSGGGSGGMQNSSSTKETTSILNLEAKLLQAFRSCILKLLKLEGSDWLFKQDDGADEDLISFVAARERFLYEAETREAVVSRLPNGGGGGGGGGGESQPNNTKHSSADSAKFLVMSVPHCGEGCVWRADLIVCFGIWCIHRVLELSLMESRPELWGKYTYVLNRLQGIIDLAFFKPRSPMSPCFCLQLPVGHQQQPTMPISNGGLLLPAKQSRGKCTTAPMLLDLIKDIEISISSRKGRTGTAAGDVAFPKGKENLASVLKRYKRRLSNKAVLASQDGARKMPL